jgi:hypothetical protein
MIHIKMPILDVNEIRYPVPLFPQPVRSGRQAHKGKTEKAGFNNIDIA